MSLLKGHADLIQSLPENVNRLSEAPEKQEDKIPSLSVKELYKLSGVWNHPHISACGFKPPRWYTVAVAEIFNFYRLLSLLHKPRLKRKHKFTVKSLSLFLVSSIVH